MSGIRIKNAITKLEDIYNDNSSYLDACDSQFVCDAREHYVTLLEEGEFEKNRQRVEWSPFNDRYGADSIRGFAAEVLAVGLWNAQEAETRFKFGDADKDTEVGGCDVVAYNPRWNNDYTVQVKTTKNIDADLIPVWNDWMKYSTHKVNRFVIADVVHRKALYLDYLQFLRCVDRNVIFVNQVMMVKREKLLATKNAKLLTQEDT
jgi:hypothetical protein